MLKKLRAKHPVPYCVLAEILFLAVLQLGGLLVALAAVFGPWADAVEMDEYMYGTLGELAGVLIGVFLLWRTNRMRLLTRRGCGFLNGLLVGMWLFVLIAYNLAGNLYYPPEDAVMRTPVQIFWFIAQMIAVGLAEEIIARAVIAQTLLEHYGTSRAGVWKAALLSGAIFGAGHLINLLASEPLGVLMQCVFAASLGVLLAAIYFRTGNLWVTIFLHSFMDIVALWTGGIYGTETVTEAISGYNTTQLLSVLIYGLPVLYLLRKKKIGTVALYFGQDGQTD